MVVKKHIQDLEPTVHDLQAMVSISEVTAYFASGCDSALVFYSLARHGADREYSWMKLTSQGGWQVCRPLALTTSLQSSLENWILSL